MNILKVLSEWIRIRPESAFHHVVPTLTDRWRGRSPWIFRPSLVTRLTRYWTSQDTLRISMPCPSDRFAAHWGRRVLVRLTSSNPASVCCCRSTSARWSRPVRCGLNFITNVKYLMTWWTNSATPLSSSGSGPWVVHRLAFYRWSSEASHYANTWLRHLHNWLYFGSWLNWIPFNLIVFEILGFVKNFSAVCCGCW